MEHDADDGREGNKEDGVPFQLFHSDKYPFGYSGRTVIMEQLLVSEDIQAYIRGDVKEINTEAIENTAKKNGLITLEQKGIIAALRGNTTLEEVSRVI